MVEIIDISNYELGKITNNSFSGTHFEPYNCTKPYSFCSLSAKELRNGLGLAPCCSAILRGFLKYFLLTFRGSVLILISRVNS